MAKKVVVINSTISGAVMNYTTRQIAELLGVDTWRVQRLFESGGLPDVPRFAGKRAIPSTMIPQIVDALRAREWLPETALNGGDADAS